MKTVRGRILRLPSAYLGARGSSGGRSLQTYNCGLRAPGLASSTSFLKRTKPHGNMWEISRALRSIAMNALELCGHPMDAPRRKCRIHLVYFFLTYICPNSGCRFGCFLRQLPPPRPLQMTRSQSHGGDRPIFFSRCSPRRCQFRQEWRVRSCGVADNSTSNSGTANRTHQSTSLVQNGRDGFQFRQHAQARVRSSARLAGGVFPVSPGADKMVGHGRTRPRPARLLLTYAVHWTIHLAGTHRDSDRPLGSVINERLTYCTLTSHCVMSILWMPVPT